MVSFIKGKIKVCYSSEVVKSYIYLICLSGKYKTASGIIYCCTKKDAEELAKELTIKYQINSAYYHGSMGDGQKEQI